MATVASGVLPLRTPAVLPGGPLDGGPPLRFTPAATVPEALPSEETT